MQNPNAYVDDANVSIEFWMKMSNFGWKLHKTEANGLLHGGEKNPWIK